MSDEKDIITKYDVEQESFVATEEDLKSLVQHSIPTTTSSTVAPKVQHTPEPPPAELPVQFEKKDLVEAPSTDNDLNTDYQYIRTNLYTITERSIDALNNLVQIADQSQHPRAYEVVSQLVNTIASAQKDLIGIHTSRAKIDALKNKSKSGDVVNNNLFVGNTAQLDDIIKNMKKKSTDDNE
jgi:hypothetical protein